MFIGSSCTQAISASVQGHPPDNNYHYSSDKKRKMTLQIQNKKSTFWNHINKSGVLFAAFVRHEYDTL